MRHRLHPQHRADRIDIASAAGSGCPGLEQAIRRRGAQRQINEGFRTLGARGALGRFGTAAFPCRNDKRNSNRFRPKGTGQRDIARSFARLPWPPVPICGIMQASFAVESPVPWRRRFVSRQIHLLVVVRSGFSSGSCSWLPWLVMSLRAAIPAKVSRLEQSEVQRPHRPAVPQHS
jgi:hypothetical protein